MKIFNRIPMINPNPYNGSKKGPPKGVKPYSQKHLNSLRDHAVQRGKVLNPYGCKGLAASVEGDGILEKAWRPKAMKRKRAVLQTKKAIALEAHEIQTMARENASVAMNTLVEISKNKRAPEAPRIAASQVILDRAYGKASQTSITANVTSNGKKSDLDGTELNKRIDSTLKRVEELTNRAPKAGTSQKRPINLRKYN
jgi:hypothetical protein